jgi:hypothetical protein
MADMEDMKFCEKNEIANKISFLDFLDSKSQIIISHQFKTKFRSFFLFPSE